MDAQQRVNRAILEVVEEWAWAGHPAVIVRLREAVEDAEREAQLIQEPAVEGVGEWGEAYTKAEDVPSSLFEENTELRRVLRQCMKALEEWSNPTSAAWVAHREARKLLGEKP